MSCMGPEWANSSHVLVQGGWLGQLQSCMYTGWDGGAIVVIYVCRLGLQ